MSEDSPGYLEIEGGLATQALVCDGPIAGMSILLPAADTWEVTIRGVHVPIIDRDGEERYLHYIAATYRIFHYGDGWSLAFLSRVQKRGE